MPFVFGMPQPGEQPRQLPHRVAVAVRLFTQLSGSQDPYVVPHGMGCEEVSCPELLVEELRVFDAASRFLADYISGKVEVKEEQQPRQLRSLVRCPQCGGSKRTGFNPCDLCKGFGALSCEPANPDGTFPQQ